MTPEQTRNIQHFILENGHACPVIIDDAVFYRDQTPGFRASLKSLPVELVLGFVDGKSLNNIETLVSRLKFDQKKETALITQDVLERFVQEEEPKRNRLVLFRF